MHHSSDRTLITRRRERQLGALLISLSSATIAGLSAILIAAIRRHGETLLQLEQLKQTPSQLPTPPQPPPDQQSLLRQYGAPAGSVGMNFELPAVDGNLYTLTLLKGARTLLIFVAIDCPQSRVLLRELAELQHTLATEELHVAIISTGDMAANREIVERLGITVPVLVQERHEVADLYYAAGTPMAYLIGSDGLTELNRIDGAQAILGVVFSASQHAETLPDGIITPFPNTGDDIQVPLRPGDMVPAIQATRLDGGLFTRKDFIGQRTLLFMFDPFCAPCIELLRDFARIHSDPRDPEVVMIARRDPAHTLELSRRHEMPYPIAFQDNWEVSRMIGALVVPAAFVVGADLHLESEIAVGQQSISDLHRQLRREQSERRLVSLAWMLQRR